MSSCWYKIWFHPRKTIRELLNYSPVSVASGVLVFITGMAYMRSISFGSSIFTGLLLYFCGSFLVGIFFVCLITLTLLATGKILGGQANLEAMVTAFLWSNIPLIPVIFLRVFGILSGWGDIGTATNMIQNPETIVLNGFRIYASIILLIGISEIQKFSLFKALLNLLSAFLAMIVFVYAFSLIFHAFI